MKLAMNGVEVEISGQDVIVNGLNMSTVIGRLTTRLMVVQQAELQLRDNYRRLLEQLRRAQDGAFESVVVDLDNLTWNVTEKPAAEEPAGTESEP